MVEKKRRPVNEKTPTKPPHTHSQVHLGAFATQDLATLAYDRAAYRQRGASARLNAPRDWRSDAWWREHASLPWPDFLTALRAWGQSTFVGAPPPVREAPPPLPLVVESTKTVASDASPPHLWSAPFSPLLPTPFGGDEGAPPVIVFFDEGLLPGGEGDGGVLPGRGSADEEADMLDVFWF